MGSKDSGGGRQTISDIIRGMQYAVNTAQDMLQRHQVEQMERYFNAETGEPLMRYVKMPDGKTVYVPLATLVPPGMLAIDELEMDFSVKVASTEVKRNGEDAGGERSSLNVFFSGTGDGGDAGAIKIRMKFKAVEEPESAARIREMLCASIL